jgi:hypothetical protein
MMENSSFDHLLGHLSREHYEQRKDVNGLQRSGPTFDWANVDDASTSVRPEHHADGYLPSGFDEMIERTEALHTQLDQCACAW